MSYRLLIALLVSSSLLPIYAQDSSESIPVDSSFSNLRLVLPDDRVIAIDTVQQSLKIKTQATTQSLGLTDCVQANELITVRRVEQPTPLVLYALSGAELIKSLDGGKQWQILNICDADNAIYADISFPTPTTGYVISRNRPNLFKTVDGGMTWKRFRSKIPEVNLESFSVHFIDDSVGYMLAKPAAFGPYYTLYKTTNGGYSFDKLSNSPHFLLDGDGLYLTQRIKPAFIGNSTIIGITEVVNNDNSKLDRLAISTDGGATWQKHLLPANGTIVNQLYAISVNNIWLFGVVGF